MESLRLKLDLQLFSQEKTESATPKKRQDSRKKGQVAKSMELPAAFILFFSFLSFYMIGGFMKEKLVDLFTGSLRHDLLMDVTMSNIQMLSYRILVQFLILLAPIMILTMVTALAANYMQIGFLLTGDPLKMKLNKINPIEGFKKIFSMRSFIDFLKSILKIVIIGVVVYLTLWGEKEKLLALSHVPLEKALQYVWSMTLMLGIKIAIILVVLAVFDYLYQRYEFEKSIRMSKQDIKDEYKKTEGDPFIKGKIREKQRRMAMQRMMQEIPKADVIITNPTHYAVAIRYDAANMQAPTVVAKGTDFVALKIREIAKEHGILIMENKPLARALHAQVELEEAIPGDLFQAVAEVLAYVYKIKGRTKRA
ncbi:flagellar biosynthesis protein FlhB [Paenibacillus lutrae]|uniref:Flagellar biosynthetic protein FlhB n=1 Tax=Paenibacillus lutrae TaxID=2078573 RepID=A0A7X3FG71_9BACL|nr:flagellar biosynthesis protein FlhB [Paenibacillus lutrae]MVO99143.1 flagellar biosynthesis protein FlhB [Paenibacillus lutrae]